MLDLRYLISKGFLRKMGQRTTVSTRLDKDLVKSIKYLAVDLERRMNDILEEAIRDVLKKYRKRPPKRSG